MYDYSSDEFPFFKVNAQAYPSKAQQVSIKPLVSGVFVVTCRLVWTCCLYAQLHFIESYLREADPGFNNLSEEDQIKVKEGLYVEVNRWDQMSGIVVVVDSTWHGKDGTIKQGGKA